MNAAANAPTTTNNDQDFRMSYSPLILDRQKQITAAGSPAYSSLLQQICLICTPLFQFKPECCSHVRVILTLATLSSLILAAHFLRMGVLAAAAACLALPVIAAVTHARWALRCLQGMLAIGSMNWIVTALRLGAERRALGEPWLRMMLILGTVAAVTALAAALLSRRSVLDRFPLPPESPVSN
jgi:hypothetical protein